MKFYIAEAKDLWTCVDKVMTAAPRRTMGGENNAVALQIIDNRLYVHRYTKSGYAEMVVPEVEILEPGHIVVGDGKLFQFYEGERVFESDNAHLVSGNDSLRLIAGDPFLYARVGPPEGGLRIEHDLSGLLWPINGNDLCNWMLLDGSDVIVHEETRTIAIANIGLPILDGLVVAPDSLLTLLKEGMTLVVENQYIWVKNGTFAAYTTTIEKPYHSGYFRCGVDEKLDPANPKITVDKAKLLAELRYIMYVTTDKIYRHGRCNLSLTEAGLEVESVGGQTGSGKRIVPAIQSTGAFRMATYPAMIVGAINSIPADQVTLEGWLHPATKLYALLVHGGNVINFISSKTEN